MREEDRFTPAVRREKKRLSQEAELQRDLKELHRLVRVVDQLTETHKMNVRALRALIVKGGE